MRRMRASAESGSIVALHWLLRIGCAMCFVGHGAWGVMTKAGWLPFYAVFGIPEWVAWKSMPLVGAIDITLGVAVLLRPCRAALAYMAVWGVFTALLRPAAGQGWWEFLERGGNYGPPIAFYVIANAQNLGWFEEIRPQAISTEVLRRTAWIMRMSIALLLIGHGGLALVQEKKVLLDHWRALGVAAGPSFLHALGAAELIAGIAALVTTSPSLLVGIASWKIATELLYPVAGRFVDVWEWVERGGDYVAPFVLLCLLSLLPQPSHRDAPVPLDLRAA